MVRHGATEITGKVCRRLGVAPQLLPTCIRVLDLSLLDEEGIVLAYDNFRVLGLLALGVHYYALLLLLELLENLDAGLLYLHGSSGLSLLITLLLFDKELLSGTVHWHDRCACPAVVLGDELFG